MKAPNSRALVIRTATKRTPMVQKHGLLLMTRARESRIVDEYGTLACPSPKMKMTLSCYYIMLHCIITQFIQTHMIPYHTILDYAILHCTILFCPILYYTIIHTILSYAKLYNTILYYIILYCTVRSQVDLQARKDMPALASAGG